MSSRAVYYPNTLHENPNMPARTFHDNGGIAHPSSHTSMFGNHHNTVPQTNLTPSTHPMLAMTKGGHNEIGKDDILFVLGQAVWSQHPLGVRRASETGNRNSHHETAVVSIQKLNHLIVAAAKYDLELHEKKTEALRLDTDNHGKPCAALDSLGFWQCPMLVAEWAQPIGVANEPYEQAGSSNSQTRLFVPTQLARTVMTKHIFQSVSSGAQQFSAQNGMVLALQYTVENVTLVEKGTKYPIVCVTGLLFDDPANSLQIKHHLADPTYPGPYSVEQLMPRDAANPTVPPETNPLSKKRGRLELSLKGSQIVVGSDSVKAFKLNPVGDLNTAVIVSIARVQHTCSRNPLGDTVLTGVFDKQVHTLLPRVSTILGCK